VRYGEHRERVPICPYCEADVDETLGAPPVPTRRLVDQRPTHVDGTSVNVRGYLCERGNYVLAIAPEHVQVDLEDAWTITVAYAVGGERTPIVVPSDQLTGGY
jgi:hypothetical protein